MLTCQPECMDKIQLEGNFRGLFSPAISRVAISQVPNDLHVCVFHVLGCVHTCMDLRVSVWVHVALRAVL